MALYAFNAEVARTREVVSEPLLGEFRLQWWRDAIAEIFAGDTVRNHPVISALAAVARAQHLPREPFDALIDARAVDLDDTARLESAALHGYVEATSSGLSWLAALALAPGGDAALELAARAVGRAWALVGLARARPLHRQMGRGIIPEDLPTAQLLAAARGALTDARQHRIKPAAVPALLPAVLADYYLNHLERVPDVVPPSPGWRMQVRLLAKAVQGRF